MKFPLKERPFDSIKLAPERYDELERHAEQVVDVTLQEFRDFVDLQNRVMAKTQWKPVKKRDNVIVYKQLTAKHHRAFGPLGVPHADNPLQLPKLVAVGSVRGCMDDMLMGTAVRDAASVLVKTSYVEDQLVDCAVLHQMRGATPDNPFRFAALKWIVKSHPPGLNSVVTPRDMIVVQSSGWIASEGIGYHLLHSVDLPEFPTLEGKYSILRSKISTMFIFRQLTPELVEIYVTNYVEPNGSAPESVAVLSSAGSMSGAWKSLGCAHNMKLSWILRNKETYLGHNPNTTINTGDACELCHRRATLTGRLADCSLCEARICSRCRVTKKLSRANRRLELTTDKYEVCKTCFVRVVNDDASRIASEMYAGAPITPWSRSTETVNRKYSIANSHGSHGSQSRASQNRASHDTVTTTSSSGMWTDRARDLRSLAYGTSSAGDRDDDVESVILEPMERESYDDDWHAVQPHYVQPYQPRVPPPAAIAPELELYRPDTREARTVTQPAGSSQDYHALYARMKSLQITAEQTYELTKDNTRKLSHRGY